MADTIKENALPQVTTIASGDNIRVVASDGTSERIDYTKLAKAIIESYNGSTIAGSAQTLQAAINSLNSKFGTVSFIGFEVATTGREITISNNYRGILFVIDSASSRDGVYYVSSTSSGASGVASAVAGSDISFDTSVTNKVSISIPSGARMLVLMTGAGSATVA